jgi:hypothetical protein
LSRGSEKLVSKFAFKFNLYRYAGDFAAAAARIPAALALVQDNLRLSTRLELDGRVGYHSSPRHFALTPGCQYHFSPRYFASKTRFN